MPLENAHNAHNAHLVQAAPGSGLSTQLGTALMLARDGIVRDSRLSVDPPESNPLPVGDRLRRIEPHFAVSALLSEAMEALAITSGLGDVSDTATLLAASKDGMRQPLLTITLPSTQDFISELQLVAGYADLRGERQPEIEVQCSHLSPFFQAILPLGAARTPAIELIIALVEDLATALVQRIKLVFSAPRPQMLSEEIQPMITSPAHGSYPSGHATQAFAIATTLDLLCRDEASSIELSLPSDDSQLYRMAARIAVNRTVAGVHFPCDSAAGALLGIETGHWLAARAGVLRQGCPGMAFEAAAWGRTAPAESRDFHLPRLCAELANNSSITALPAIEIGTAPLLSALWAVGRDEWSNRWN